MYRWEVPSEVVLQDVFIIMNQIIEASKYRYFGVQVDVRNNADEGVNVQSLTKFFFDLADVDDAFQMISDHVDLCLRWSYDVEMYLIECGAPIQDGAD